MLSSGGEVMARERELRSMHESLRMTVAIPFLFGVPPAYEMLRSADCLAAASSHTPCADALYASCDGSGGHCSASGW